MSEVLPMLRRAPRLPRASSRPEREISRFLHWNNTRAGKILWSDEGVGWYSVEGAPYDQAYFEKYQRYGLTEMGEKLNAARVAFVARYYRGLLCDVGAGAGSFIDMRWDRRRQLTLGYDVNPASAKWLEERSLFVDPYLAKLPALSLWDVLEHVEDFSRLITNCRDWLFLSLPIFSDRSHAERSKHFRRDEHFWYFTANGLVFLMSKFHFELVAQNDMETQLGREDIGTFAFRRKVA
jgi:hypothetical protein